VGAENRVTAFEQGVRGRPADVVRAENRDMVFDQRVLWPAGPTDLAVAVHPPNCMIAVLLWCSDSRT
jgi:hypothetical protein